MLKDIVVVRDFCRKLFIPACSFLTNNYDKSNLYSEGVIMPVFKIAISLLTAGGSLLIYLAYFPPHHNSGEPVQYLVADRVITQSLDGDRHYLLIRTNDDAQDMTRINVGRNVQCRKGDMATIQPISTGLSSKISYQFIDCN